MFMKLFKNRKYSHDSMFSKIGKKSNKASYFIRLKPLIKILKINLLLGKIKKIPILLNKQSTKPN